MTTKAGPVVIMTSETLSSADTRHGGKTDESSIFANLSAASRTAVTTQQTLLIFIGN